MKKIISLTGILAAAVVAAAQQPANDHFAAAQVLSGNTATVTGQNTAATKEVGEPNHAGAVGGHSVWYRWTAPTNGVWIVDTFGTSFDTTLAVYTGSALGSLTPVASSDDARQDSSSRVTINTSAGTTYHIALDGYGTASGDFSLKLLLFSMPLPRPKLSLGLDRKIRFTSPTNTVCQLFASDNLSSWQPLGGPIDAPDQAVAVDVNFNEAPRRFFRAQVSPKSSQSLSNGLFRGLSLKDEMEVETRRWISFGVTNVFLAGAYTGTLRQQGQNWVYEPLPTDRLNVVFPTETNSIHYLAFSGDFSDASSFLDRDHTVVFGLTNISRGLGLQVESYRAGSEGFSAISGKLRDSTGLELTGYNGISTRIVGTLITPGLDFTFSRQRFGVFAGQDFQIIVDEQVIEQNVSATGNPYIVRRTSNSRSTWQTEGNSFAMEVLVKLSFKNGYVNEFDHATEARGDIAVNSQPFATYSLGFDIPSFVTVRLTYPDGIRDLVRYELCCP